MKKSMQPDASAIQSRIASIPHWYHQIEVAPGITTPGTHASALGLSDLDEIGLPRDRAGKRVLDIGARDGYFSFACERRGAEVVAMDYAAPEVTGFSVASDLLHSQVEYRIENVYNLDPSRHGAFDIVLFLGVLYHLRNPLLALDRIRAVLRTNGLLLVETQLSTELNILWSKRPVWQFLPGDSFAGDHTNTWAPNLIGLQAAIEECEFRVVTSKRRKSRGYVAARAVENDTQAYYRRLDSATDLWGKPSSSAS
jgi:tRNA (mo5U34)-methyltransferase